MADPIEYVKAAEKSGRKEISKTVGQAAPKVPGGLDPKLLSNLADILKEAMSELTDGEMVPEIELDGESDQMPESIFTALVALAKLVDKEPAARKYAFDPVESASSDDMVAEVMDNITRLMGDARAVTALTKPYEKDEQPVPMEEPMAEGEPKNDMKGLM